MGAWKDLPDELAIMVLHWLDRMQPKEWWNSPRVNQDILRCSYVSRQFHDIVEPILYREVKLRVEALEDEVSFSQLRNLARTIASRPRLGDLVQKLDAYGLVVSDEPSDAEDVVNLCNTVLTPEDLKGVLENTADNDHQTKKILLDVTTRLGLSNGLALQGDSIGEFILLLHLLPRLQELQMEMGDDMAIVALASLRVFSGSVPAGLQSLSKLSIFYQDTEVTSRFYDEASRAAVFIDILSAERLLHKLGRTVHDAALPHYIHHRFFRRRRR